jgi:outer membrane protein TolC
MRREVNGLLAAVAFAWTTWMPGFAAAQTALTLQDAIARARQAAPEARARAAAAGEAEARLRQARAGYLPRVDVSETVQRGNQPVFVFGSLLAQRRFTESNFAIAELNRPGAVTNARTAITVSQPLFDAGLTRLGVRAASAEHEIAIAERERSGQDLAYRAAQAYLRVLQLEAAARAHHAAVAAAESDAERARARRSLGVVTEADVLAIEAHAAAMRQRRIAGEADLEVARVELAAIVGGPLDAAYSLIPPAPSAAPTNEAIVAVALQTRIERRQADLRQQLANAAYETAKASFLPTVAVQAGWESNGSTMTDQQSSWVIGAHVQWNAFRGNGDRARLAEARHAQTRASAEREQVARAIELDVRAALARVSAARASEETGRAALRQARESQRIIRDRYESGLATMTDVLRAGEAVLDAEARAIAAQMDVILSTVALDHAAGRL